MKSEGKGLCSVQPLVSTIGLGREGLTRANLFASDRVNQRCTVGCASYEAGCATVGVHDEVVSATHESIATYIGHEETHCQCTQGVGCVVVRERRSAVQVRCGSIPLSEVGSVRQLHLYVIPRDICLRY